MSQRSEAVLEGRLERITFYNEETHYLIARLRSKETSALVSILGYMPEPKLGESLRINGHWQTHQRFGNQFRFESFEVVLPSTLDEISAYLQSGIITGLGAKTVARILDRYQEKTIEIIENSPDKLSEIKGIGTKTAQRIAQEWQAHHTVRRLMRFLEQHQIPSAHAAKLMRLYGDDAERILRNTPFQVAADLPRIGFFIADKIIQSSDVAVDQHQRARACLRHLLDLAISDGNVFEYQQPLLAKAGELFDIDRDTGLDAIAQLSEDQEIVIDPTLDTEAGPAIYPAELHEAETTIGNRLNAAVSIPGNLPEISNDTIAAAVLKRLAIRLSQEQEAVLRGTISQKVSIITGGPGTGKTTLIQSISTVLESLGLTILLAAPTGRAARRLSEVTRRPAATLHKLLGCSIEDGYFEKDQDDPLETDAVIVDEVSMVDTLLFSHLLKAIPLTSMIVLVGDLFQLPSVGPGNVLADLIRSGCVPTFELTEIFRQARKSTIVLNAHHIRNGQMPELPHLSGHLFSDLNSDFNFIEQKTPELVAESIVELCAEKIPDRFGLHAIEQIQVLTPMHKGVVGTLNLNRLLQARLNPAMEETKGVEGRFRTGDKVMHLRNNYQKEVFNGDIGTILEVDSSTRKIRVNYDGREVIYEQTESDELSLAYAISIHKSQGSEYPAIVVPVLTQHYAMLQRNLLYTAVTRGKQVVILIGSRKALAIALNNDRPRKRRSGLAARITAETGIKYR